MEIVKDDKAKKDSSGAPRSFNFFDKVMQAIKPPKQNIKKELINNENIKLNGFSNEPSESKTVENEQKVSSKQDLIATENERGIETEFEVIDKINTYLKDTKEEFEKNHPAYAKNQENDDSSSTLANEDAQNFSETTIESLPIELVCKIIDYLEFSDRKNASLVCKKWRNAFLESYFLKDILVKANNHLFLSNRPPSSRLPSANSTKNLANSNVSYPAHRAASTMALSSYSTRSTFNTHLYANVVNLEFENDSADVSLLLSNLKMQIGTSTHAKKAVAGLLPKLSNLKFTKTTMSSKTLVDIFNEAPKLKSLHLIQCDSLFMTGFLTYSTIKSNNGFNLSNLTSLSLSKNRYLTDFLLNMFVNSAPSLKSIDISFCILTKTNYKSISNSINYNNGINIIGSSDSGSGSTVVLTIENLIKQLSKLNDLNSLNLSGIDLFNHDDSLLLSLIESLPRLEELYLSNLPTLKVQSVNKIFNKLPKLKLIDLNASIQIDDSNQKSIESIFETADRTLSNLETLKLNKAKINDPELLVKQISCLNRLVYLDLSCVMFQRSFGTVNRLNLYIESFAASLAECESLQYLILSYCDFLVNDTFVKTIARKLTKLKHLDLRNCSQITDQSLHHISYYLAELVHLDLSWCQNISDYGLDSSIEYSKDKQLLNEFKKHLNGSCRCMRKYTEQPFLLLKTKTELAQEMKKQFCSCSGSTNSEDLNESSLKNEKFNELFGDLGEELSLKKLKHLKVLRLESCVNISDIGLFNGVNLGQLYELDIKLCTNINGDFIFSLMKDFEKNAALSSQFNKKNLKLFNNLKVLNLNQCIKFKQDNLLNIVEHAPNLRELSVSAISSISNSLIELLLNLKKLLVYLDISFCPSINESWVEKYEQYLYSEFGSREFHLDKRSISK